MEQLSNPRPQVMFDIRVFQISHQLTRNIGVHIPNTFNLYNIPAAALAGLAGQNIQQLINQLISSGGINQLGNSALSGLLSQLGGQQNSIFSQPLATFGGGLTFMGLSLDQFAAALVGERIVGPQPGEPVHARRTRHRRELSPGRTLPYHECELRADLTILRRFRRFWGIRAIFRHFHP